MAAFHQSMPGAHRLLSMLKFRFHLSIASNYILSDNIWQLCSAVVLMHPLKVKEIVQWDVVSGSIEVWLPNAGKVLLKKLNCVRQCLPSKWLPRWPYGFFFLLFFFSPQGDVTSNNFERDFADDFPAWQSKIPKDLSKLWSAFYTSRQLTSCTLSLRIKSFVKSTDLACQKK